MVEFAMRPREVYSCKRQTAEKALSAKAVVSRELDMKRTRKTIAEHDCGGL